jgi:hypothetical protein
LDFDRPEIGIRGLKIIAAAQGLPESLYTSGTICKIETGLGVNVEGNESFRD